MAKYSICGNTFCGNKISDYSIEHGFLDYCTFAKAFDAILNNEIWGKVWEMGFEWYQENGFPDDEEEEDEQCAEDEVYQWFIVSDSGAEMIKDYTNEILYYCEELDIYLWGVTHFGTSWDYVLMDIPCNVGYDNI